MLGSLARKLRALGFDTVYFKDGEDTELINLCKDERRTLLTSDKALCSRAAAGGVRAILVMGASDPERISLIGKAFRAGGIPLTPGEPRCSVCNGVLEKVRANQGTVGAPPSVIANHRDFFRCGSCGKLYWKGSHWKKLRSLRARMIPR
jgi:uncharacterized protein